MFNAKEIAILAPYGSMEFTQLATKVGSPKSIPVGKAPSSAPYGSMKFTQLATKVSGKATGKP